MSNFKSQIKQDKYISEFIFNNKKKGFFIELGALDGINLSNTYYFEKELNWDGLCIEANPNYNEKLKKNRNCKKDYNIIYSQNDIELDFFITDNGAELSGILNHKGYLGESKIIDNKKIKTKTLTYVLDSIKAPKIINYLSLDVEGSEYEVLKGIDFNKYTIEYISVEHNYDTELRKKIHKILQNNNFIYSRWNKFEDEYIHLTLYNKIMWYDLKN